MTQPPPSPLGATGTLPLPPPSANGSGPPPAPAPQAAERVPLQARLSAMRITLIAGLAVLIAAVIFTIQNVHAANISFLGVHLVLPLAGALLLAAIAGSLATVAAGPARITKLRQIMRHGMRKIRGNSWAPYEGSPRGPDRTLHGAREAPAAFSPGDQPGNTTI
jgi:lipopolysaccharide assembly protein A